MWSRISKVYSAMNIKDAAKIGFDDEPFYQDMDAYIAGESMKVMDVEFHENDACKELFDKYDKMDKVRY